MTAKNQVLKPLPTSGMIATVEVEVWTLPADSVAGTL